MTNAQLYTLLAPALLAVFGVFFNAWRTDKRIDDLRADMNRQFDKMDRRFEQVALTLQAIRQDLADGRARLAGHDADIANLKDRIKS